MTPGRLLSWIWLTSSRDKQVHLYPPDQVHLIYIWSNWSDALEVAFHPYWQDRDQRVGVFQLDTSQRCLCCIGSVQIFMCLCNAKHKWEYSLGVFKFHNPNLTSLHCLHMELGWKGLNYGWTEGDAILLILDTALVVTCKLAIYRLNMIPHQNKNDTDIVW